MRPSRVFSVHLCKMFRLILLLLYVSAGHGIAAGSKSASGKKAVVSTVHPLASAAALQAIRDGGNAVDAAVAAALTLGVVDGHNSGIGGGCFLLIRLPDGKVAAIDGREQAPAAATRDMFIRDGKADTRLSQTGALAIGVPGSVAAYDLACRKYGKLSLAHHLNVAAGLAENGFAVTKTLAERMSASAEELKQFPASRAALLKADGSTYAAGELFRQPDLAKSYRAMAQEGIGWFYGGEFAGATEAWMKANGGLLTAKDFKSYELKLREPIRTTYRGYEMVGFPPPSSGGVHVAQILNILEPFNLRKMKAGSADFIHVVTEAMKLAFADRAYWLGDPDFAPVPRGLIAKNYSAQLAKQIDMKRARAVPSHGKPERSEADLFGKHTTHFSTADAQGNWVACTATINTTFGSKVVIPGTGIVMNNQMDDFSIEPGTANYFGLVGAEANAIAPGKRPLSSMSPTLVMKDGKPVLSVGAAGGPTIITQTLLALVNWIDFQMPLEKALAQPRFHHQWMPDELRIEDNIPEKIRAELLRRGHRLKLVGPFGATQATEQRKRGGELIGQTDPRGQGVSLGLSVQR